MEKSMGWFKTHIVSTISALFSSGLSSAPGELEVDVGIEEIRAAMLCCSSNSLSDSRIGEKGIGNQHGSGTQPRGCIGLQARCKSSGGNL
jgi:hypothetical protein